MRHEEAVNQDSQTGNVVEFKPAKKRRALNVKEPEYPRCEHRHVLVSERDRTLECEDCKKLVDPIQYLVEWAKKLRRIEYDIEAWQAMHREHAGADFDARWKEEARKIKERPEEPEARKIWDEAASYMNGKPFSISKRRNAAGGWWVHEILSTTGGITAGASLSIEYVRSLSAKRQWQKAKS